MLFLDMLMIFFHGFSRMPFVLLSNGLGKRGSVYLEKDTGDIGIVIDAQHACPDDTFYVLWLTNDEQKAAIENEPASSFSLVPDPTPEQLQSILEAPTRAMERILGGFSAYQLKLAVQVAGTAWNVVTS